jgi:polar amino acid transport system substrate-binding protein
MTSKRRAIVAAGALLVALACGAGPANARALNDIRTRGAIALCAAPNALPFASRKGPPRGVDIDLAQAIADRLGVALRVDWVTLAYQYRAVDCDIVMGVMQAAGVTEEIPLRRSIAYHSAGLVMGLGATPSQVTAFSELPKNARIGVQVGSLAQTLLGQRGMKVIPFAFEDEIVAALADGQIDAAAATAMSIGWYNHQHADRPVRAIYPSDAGADLGWELTIGMRRADDLLIREIDAILLALLQDGSVARIYAAYGIEHRPPRGGRENRLDHATKPDASRR